MSAVCGSHYVKVSTPAVHCGTCGRSRRMLYRLDAWRGGYFTCLTCGENYHQEFGRMERPFRPKWRKESVDDAREFLRRHGCKKLDLSEVLELTGPGGA